MLPYTNRPTLIAVIADRITPGRNTIQIVGYVGMVGGKLRSLIGGAPKLIANDGAGVTETLVNGLSNLKIPAEELDSRSVGGAFDGKYFNLGVPRNVFSKLERPDEAKDWYTYT